METVQSVEGPAWMKVWRGVEGGGSPDWPEQRAEELGVSEAGRREPWQGLVLF